MTSDPRRRGLGRGLDALLASSARSLPPAGSDPDPFAGTEIAVDAIDPNPEQPRTHFDPERLEELAQSIRTHGVLQPIVVEADGHGGYRLVAGERRLRAARQAGLASIPAVVRPAAESARLGLELALVENLQRADLGALEEAMAFARLADAFGLSHDAIALRVGRSRPAVTNAIRLLGLPAEVQEHLAGGRITAGHARALLPLPEAAAVALAARIVDGHLTVRATEQAVAAALQEAAAVGPAPSSSDVAVTAPQVGSRPAPPVGEDDASFTRGLEEALGTPVRLDRRRRGGGRLVIDFYDDTQLDDLYTRLGGPEL